MLDFDLDHCASNNCGADQTCVTLADKFTCVCNDSDTFLVNGNCSLPGSSAKVRNQTKKAEMYVRL